MYFKVSGRHNPNTNQPGWYYRLVESYRNSEGRVCHRTMLNVGFLEGLSTDQMNLIQKMLTQRCENTNNLLFALPLSADSIVNQYVDAYYKRLVDEKRIDVLVDSSKKKPTVQGKDLEMIDLNSISNKDVREIGAEWISYPAAEQLQIRAFLEGQGWSDLDIRLAQTHIISRAVYPASEAAILILKYKHRNTSKKKVMARVKARKKTKMKLKTKMVKSWKHRKSKS